jgi:TPR repeat protein
MIRRCFVLPRPAALLLAVGFAGSVAAGPFEDGVAAYQRGDYAMALPLFRKAAEQGFVVAQNNLGFMYANGQGVPQDYAAAVSWYRKAAEQGDATAQFNLGAMHYDGHGVSQDYSAAVSWYRKAAEQGLAKAQGGLGVMYATGKGVPQDYVIAHMWFNLAAAGGEKISVQLRDALAGHMTPAQISEAQKLAREWKPASAPR